MEESDYLSLLPHKGVARWSTVNLFPHWCNGNYGEVCVGRVPYGPAVPGPSTPAGGCGCRPRTSTRRWPRRRRGLLARRVSSSTSGGPASKGRSPREFVPLAYAGADMGAWRRPTCSTSRSPPRSISTALSRGSTSAHGPRRVPPALPLWRPQTRTIEARQPPDIRLRFSRPLHPASQAEGHHFDLFLYYISNFCIRLVENRSQGRRLSGHTFLPCKHFSLLYSDILRAFL
jgi:hypothetical protein